MVQVGMIQVDGGSGGGWFRGRVVVVNVERRVVVVDLDEAKPRCRDAKMSQRGARTFFVSRARCCSLAKPYA